jgi:integrase/recombinase XerD
VLTAYRRHLSDCPHLPKGQAYTLCGCPIWAYGVLNGKRIRQSLGTADTARALRRIAELENGDGQAEEVPAGPTVAAAVSLFIASSKERNLKASTLASYSKTLAHLSSFKAFINEPVSAISTPALDAYKSSRTIAPSTWRKELETLRAFFYWCEERGWCQKNPARKLKMPLVDDLKTQPFSGDEVRSLIAAAGDLSSDNPAETEYVRRRARALMYVLLYSGLRISDVAELQRSALASTRHLTLRVLKNGVRLKVLLHPTAADALSSLPAQNPKYFFWTGKGDVMTCIKNMRRTIQRIGKIAGIHAHPHRFRDTFAVELLTNGADIRTVQKLLGHTSVKTTEKHYAHFVAAHQALLDSAASTLDFESGSGGPLLVHPVGNRRRNA